MNNALLDAAWAELVDKGYDAFRMGSVVDRALTGKAALYRRWPGKAELVRCAIAEHCLSDHVAVPVTGSLRSDLIELLQTLNAIRVPPTLLLLRLGAFYAETGMSIADLSEQLSGRDDSVVAAIFDRAVRRGEADAAKLTPRVRQVVVDLHRHEVLMTGHGLPHSVIESIVDEVVVPLVRMS